MEPKYIKLACEIWAEMTPEQRLNALKPIDIEAELKQSIKEAFADMEAWADAQTPLGIERFYGAFAYRPTFNV